MTRLAQRLWLGEQGVGDEEGVVRRGGVSSSVQLHRGKSCSLAYWCEHRLPANQESEEAMSRMGGILPYALGLLAAVDHCPWRCLPMHTVKNLGPSYTDES